MQSVYFIKQQLMTWPLGMQPVQCFMANSSATCFPALEIAP